MNIPNFLTLIRILLVPLLVIFLIEGKTDFALLVFMAAGLSDGLDGFLARLLKQKTALGAILDPLADKLLLISSYVTMAILGIVPSWISVFVVSRDIIILTGIGVLEFNSKSMKIKPTFDSKITTFFQLLTICFFLGINYLEKVEWLGGYLIYITAFMTVYSGLHYIKIGFNILQETNNSSAVKNRSK